MTKKIERCIKKVKRKNINPYAICNSSIKKAAEREIKIGTIIEQKEHGFNIKISRKIAMDHIKESPKYYTHKRYGLIATERKLKNIKG